MQRNINEEAQARRRKEAWHSAAFSSALLLISSFLILTFLHFFPLGGFWQAVMVVLALLELGMIIPVWILLKTRLKEIEGGEEDAAAQY